MRVPVFYTSKHLTDEAPDRLTSTSPKMPFKKFKPPRRYTNGAINPGPSLGVPRNTPTSILSSPSSTAVASTYNPTSSQNTDSAVSPQDRGVSLQPNAPCLHKLSQLTLREIVTVLREGHYDQGGTCTLIILDDDGAFGDLAAELPAPALYLRTQTSRKVRRLLNLDGFTRPGILILKIGDPDEGGRARDVWD